MNPNETPEFRRAMELSLQARHQTLPEEDALWLRSYLASHPVAVSEAAADQAFLGRLQDVRMPVRPQFRERLNESLADLARSEERRSRSAARGGSGAPALLARFTAFLFGREQGTRTPSFATQLLGRGLAFYLGVCLTACLWLWSEPEVAEGTSLETSRGRSALEQVLPRDGGPRGPGHPVSDSRPGRGR